MIVMKYIYLIIFMLVLMPAVAAVPMYNPTINVSTAITGDCPNGTYTKYYCWNALSSGNISVWDMAYGAYKPAGDSMVNWTGVEDAWWWIFAIIGFLWIFGIWVQTGSAKYAGLATIPIAPGLAILMPNILLALVVTFVSYCVAGAIYMLFVSQN